MKLTKEQINDIPTQLSLGQTIQSIATAYQVHPMTIQRWIKIMRGQGRLIIIPKGRRPLQLN